MRASSGGTCTAVQASYAWRLTKATDQASAGVVKAGAIRVQQPWGLRQRPRPPKGGGTTPLSVKED